MNKQKGFSLVETMIVAFAIVILTALVYSFFHFVAAKQNSSKEMDALMSLSTSINEGYRAASNFDNLNNNSLIAEQLVPQMYQISGTTITSPNGYDVQVAPRASAASYYIRYFNVPAKECSQLVSQVVASQTFFNITIGDKEVTATDINENNVVAGCNYAPTVRIAFEFRPFGTPSNFATLEQCVLPSPDYQERNDPCPTGYSGSITMRRQASCPGPYEMVAWTAWEEVNRTCQIICVPEPSSPETRKRSCPTGYLGEITDQRTSVCANYNGYPTWSDWNEKANTCLIACVVPDPTVVTAACPTNYVGSIVTTTTYNCPAATGSPVANSPTVNNTCVQTCSSQLPTPNPQIQYINKTRPCGTGYSGSITYQEEQKNTYSCPSNTGAPSQTGWVATGNIRNESTAACVSLCKPETVLEQWIGVTGSCPSGYTGSNTWEKQQTRTSTCSPGNVNPTTSAWTDSGQIRNQNNSCLKLCVVPDPTVVTSSCPTNYTGSVVTTTTYTCPTSTGNPVANQPTVNNTCVSVCKPETVLSQWVAASAACPSGYVGSHTWEKQQTRTSTCAAGAATPVTSAWTDTGATRNTVNSCVALCVVPTPSTKSETQSVTETQRVACLAGTYGPTNSITQTRTNTQTRTSTAYCPAQTGAYAWGAWSAWTTTANGTWTTTSNTCTACPAPVTGQAEYRWEDRSVGCPSGYNGTRYVEYYQKRTYTTSYSCPAGATAPTPSNGSYSGWADTGQTRNDRNSCVIACTPPAATNTAITRAVANENQTLACSSGYIGQIQQTRTRTENGTRRTTWTCPGPTSSTSDTWLGTYNYGAWTTTSNTCTICNNTSGVEYNYDYDTGCSGSRPKRCEYGSAKRNVVRDCQNNLVSAGAWTVISNNVCVANNNNCP